MDGKAYVIYNGRRMIAGWPERIEDAQKVTRGSIRRCRYCHNASGVSQP